MPIIRPSLFTWLVLSVFFFVFLSISTEIDAQEEVTETPTPESTVTPTPTPIPISLTIFRDTDTFTLYAPAQGEISLAGLTFVVDDEIYALENFAAFRGLPYSHVPTPVCFRLARSGANSPLPQDCTSALILTQMLSNADVFWYDSVLVQDLVVLVQREGETQGICASGQAECDIAFTPGEVTPTPTATITVTRVNTATATIPVAVNTPTPIAGVYPCDGTIVVSTSPGVGLNKVHVIAQLNSPNRPPVSQGSTVSVLGTQHTAVNARLAIIIGFKFSKKVIGHSGGLPGYTTNISLVPSMKLSVIVFTNTGTMPVEISNGLLELLIPVFEREAARQQPKPSAEEIAALAPYAGHYHWLDDDELELKVVKGKLKIIDPDFPSLQVALIPVGEGRFRIEGGPHTADFAEFETDNDGKIAGFTLAGYPMARILD